MVELLSQDKENTKGSITTKYSYEKNLLPKELRKEVEDAGNADAEFLILLKK